jgi:hypothetical protein
MSLLTPAWFPSFAILLLTTVAACAQPSTNGVFVARAEQAFLHARQDWTAHPDDVAAACALGRTTYDWAEFVTNAEQRASIARTGIAACQHLLERDPKTAVAHYYLGMDYGELAAAEAPSLAAYKLIREIEGEFKVAADLDERLDHAGPLRCLGLLYRDAPGWPVSIGSRRKAREFLERAAVLSPEYPGNLMNLLESHVKWRQESEAEESWRKLQALWPVARTNLAGVAWEADWGDWIYRREVVKADFRKAFKHEPEP